MSLPTTHVIIVLSETPNKDIIVNFSFEPKYDETNKAHQAGSVMIKEFADKYGAKNPESKV